MSSEKKIIIWNPSPQDDIQNNEAFIGVTVQLRNNLSLTSIVTLDAAQYIMIFNILRYHIHV